MYIVERCGIETWDVLQLLQPWGHPGTPTNKVAASVSLSLSLSLSGETEEKVQGVYYGTFPGDEKISSGLTSVWVVSRPHNWRPATAEESLLHLSLPDGVEIERKPLPSSCVLPPRASCSAIRALSVERCGPKQN